MMTTCVQKKVNTKSNSIKNAREVNFQVFTGKPRAKGLSPTHNHLPSNLRPIFYCAGKVLMDVRRSWHL